MFALRSHHASEAYATKLQQISKIVQILKILCLTRVTTGYGYREKTHYIIDPLLLLAENFHYLYNFQTCSFKKFDVTHKFT
jgi:hypothetical protein